MIAPATPRQPKTIPRTVGGIHVKNETTRSSPGHDRAMRKLVSRRAESGEEVKQARETGDADQRGRRDAQQGDHLGRELAQGFMPHTLAPFSRKGAP